MKSLKRWRSKKLIHELTDVSHNAARRCSIDIVLDNDASVNQEVRHVVAHYRLLAYQVIYIYVYTSWEDIPDANWICRSQWIDDDLEHKPNRLEGTRIGNGIIVDWK